jgi:hypothetical protein
MNPHTKALDYERAVFDHAFFKNESGGGLKEFCWRLWQARAAISQSTGAQT